MTDERILELVAEVMGKGWEVNRHGHILYIKDDGSVLRCHPLRDLNDAVRVAENVGPKWDLEKVVLGDGKTHYTAGSWGRYGCNHHKDSTPARALTLAALKAAGKIGDSE